MAPLEILLEWGPTGAAALAPHCDVAVVVDVLSFSTTVTVAADRGAQVVPYRWTDDSAAAVAAEWGAALAVGREDAGPGQVSLSPKTVRDVAELQRVLLPSPNGSTICAVIADAGAEVVVASLRNRRAVAAWLHARGGRVLMVPAGERWPDDSLRPAIEDLWGAGGVVAALADLAGLVGGASGVAMSDEAQAAAAAYRLVEGRVAQALVACPSGQELVGRGYASDVTIAAELDSSSVVPRLVDGTLTASR